MADRNRRYTLGAIALPFFFLMMSGLARATTFFVTELDDSGPGSLRDAIAAANAATGANTIEFANGLTGTITLVTPLPAITGNLQIQGPPTAPGITIDGGGKPLMQVNSGAAVALQYLTMTNGYGSLTTTSMGVNSEGGAIFNGGNLQVSDSTFSDNRATGASGGAGEGGAIFNDGNLQVQNSTFSDNQATGGAGTDLTGGAGGLGSGGAIYNNGGLVTVINSTFSANQATGGAAGFGSLSIGGNGGGGGIFNYVGETFITNGTFSGNEAVGGAPATGTGSVGGSGSGGAIYIRIVSSTVTDRTFSANQATSDAEGVTASLKGTILAASTGGNCAGMITDVGYNMADDTSCGFGAGTGASGQTIGDGVNPLLVTAGLANNGGPTETIALQPTSPAIDAIPFASCTDQAMPPNQLTTDQRGEPRPDPADGPDGPCDIGAYEFQKPAPVPVTLKITPKAIKFPKTKVGTASKPKTVKVSNPKGNKKHPGLPVVIEMISDPGIFTETNDCPASLAAGSSCTIAVTFTPSAAAEQTGTLTITDNANGNPQTVQLSGRGK